MDKTNCKETCGEEHGVVCTLMAGLQKQIDALEKKIDKILENRDAAMKFVIANGIAFVAVLLALYSAFHERKEHDQFPEKTRQHNVESGVMPRNGRVDYGGERSDLNHDN